MDNEMKRLPDSELEIMMVLWEAGEPVSSAYVIEKLKGKRNWKITSVLTFLSRLAQKGFISVEKDGKSNIYRPLIDEQDYLKYENRSFLEKLYGNSVTTFVSSLYNSKEIGEKELDELRRFIDEASKGE
ncbi:MAG: BlaI/MecI/CopY family transcriptional regulator [Bacillota bacterium]|nr:BlaI/MecI/CopY family transcriptional regulator [Bacillota bacterium]